MSLKVCELDSCSDQDGSTQLNDEVVSCQNHLKHNASFMPLACNFGVLILKRHANILFEICIFVLKTVKFFSPPISKTSCPLQITFFHIGYQIIYNLQGKSPVGGFFALMHYSCILPRELRMVEPIHVPWQMWVVCCNPVWSYRRYRRCHVSVVLET